MIHQLVACDSTRSEKNAVPQCVAKSQRRGFAAAARMQEESQSEDDGKDGRPGDPKGPVFGPSEVISPKDSRPTW